MGEDDHDRRPTFRWRKDLSASRKLLRSGLDSWQAGELLEAFLAEHGYGVSKNEAQIAAKRIGSIGFSLIQVREELEKLALAM